MSIIAKKDKQITKKQIIDTFKAHSIQLHPAGQWQWDENREKSPINAQRKDGLALSKHPKDNIFKHRAELSGVAVLDCDGIPLDLVDKWFPSSVGSFYTTTSKFEKQHRYIYPPEGKTFPESRAIKDLHKDLDIITFGIVFEAHDYLSKDSQFTMNNREIKRCSIDEYDRICEILEPKTKTPKQNKKADNKNPIIAIFNQKFSCEELLMAQGYLKLHDRLIHPESESGIAGIIFFDDGCVYSHSSDWLNDGSSHDAFDIYAHYEHEGNKSIAMASARDLLNLNYYGFEKCEDPIDYKRLQHIKDHVGYSSTEKVYYMLNREGKLIQSTKADFWDFAQRTFPPAFNYERVDEEMLMAIEEQTNALSKDLSKSDREDAIEAIMKREERTAKAKYKAFASTQSKALLDIKYNNSFEMMDYQIDPFAKVHSIQITGSTMKVVTNNLFPNLDLNEIKTDYGFAKKVYQDFKQHFPEFPLILDMIIASRFGGDRKKSFLYTQMPSDFGKSFMAEAFRRLELLVELNVDELKAIIKGQTVSVNSSEFRTAWIVFFDEFKQAPAELKNITHAMQVNAKYMMRQQVQLYFKWFASAETSHSLLGNGGVETQFAKRTSFIDKPNGKTLESRDLFKSGHDEYLSGLTYAIYAIIKSKSKAYIEMGKKDAEKEAQKVVDKFRSKYALKATLDDNVDEMIDDMIAFAKYNAYKFDGNEFMHSSVVKDLEDRAKQTFALHNDNLYIQNMRALNTFFLEYIKNETGDRNSGKMAYKADLLRKRFGKRKDIGSGGRKLKAYPLKYETLILPEKIENDEIEDNLDDF